MLVLKIVLRLLHILGGIFWVGSGLLSFFFLSPAAQATKETGQKFMGYIAQKTSLVTFIYIAAYTTVGAGAVLYWIDSNGLKLNWIRTGPGIGFGLGAIAALVGLYYGVKVGHSTTALGKLGMEIQSQGTPPTEEQLKSMQTLQAQLKTGGLVNIIGLILAAVLMATARYWVF